MAVVDSSRAGQSALLTSDLDSALEMKVDLICSWPYICRCSHLMDTINCCTLQPLYEELQTRTVAINYSLATGVVFQVEPDVIQWSCHKHSILDHDLNENSAIVLLLELMYHSYHYLPS